MKRWFYFAVCLVFLWACRTAPRNQRGQGGEQRAWLTLENEHFRAEPSPHSGENSGYVRFINKDTGKTVKRSDLVVWLVDGNFTGYPEVQAFQNLLIESLIKTPFTDDQSKGFFFKTPILNDETKDDDFYYYVAAQDFTLELQDNFKDYFFNCEKRPEGSRKNSPDYQAKFQGIYGYVGDDENPRFSFEEDPAGRIATTFPPHKSATVRFHSDSKTFLVSPCPFDSDLASPENKPLLHLRSYLKSIESNPKRIGSFWNLVQKSLMEKYLAGEDVLMNTHGLAVGYLHFRVEEKKTYYKGEYKDLAEVEGSRRVYQEKFED